MANKFKVKKKVSEICTNHPNIHEKIMSLFEHKGTPIQLENLSSSYEQELIY